MIKDAEVNLFIGIATVFFFLGWVVFEGYKITIPTGTISPFVVVGFIFAFGASLIYFKKQMKKLGKMI